MSLSTFIILLVKAIIKILSESMQIYEKSDDFDPDGIPLNSEYGKQSFLLCLLSDFVTEFNKALQIDCPDEK